MLYACEIINNVLTAKAILLPELNYYKSSYNFKTGVHKIPSRGKLATVQKSLEAKKKVRQETHFYDC